MSESSTSNSFECAATKVTLAVLAYLLLPGPLVFMEVRHLLPDALLNSISVAYLPLDWLAEHWAAFRDSYLDYLLWWRYWTWGCEGMGDAG